MYRRLDSLDCGGRRGRAEAVEIIVRVGRGLRVVQERHARDLRRNLAQEIESLAGQRSFDVDKAGYVAAGIGEARNKAAAHRIGDDCKHGRDRACLPLKRGGGGRRDAEQNIGIEPDQLLSE
jgi:hypothetical protein